MKNKLVKLVGGILLGGSAMAAILPACGGSSDETAPTVAVVQPTATAVATPTSAPAPTATVAPAPSSSSGSSDSDLLAQGKLIFEKTAGGVGCAWCHGMDGKGSGPSGMGAPANRGADKDRFLWALDGGVTDAMTFIDLIPKEIDAVLAYLQFLATQP